MLCRYTIKRNAQGYWQILFPICTQISHTALLEISRKIPTGNNIPIGICLLSAIDENPTLQYISCHPGYRYHHVLPGAIPFDH